MESRIPKVSPGHTYNGIHYGLIESAAGRRAPNSPFWRTPLRTSPRVTLPAKPPELSLSPFPPDSRCQLGRRSCGCCEQAEGWPLLRHVWLTFVRAATA